MRLLPDQIRWIRPEASGERATLDAWCRGVGPAIVIANPHVTPAAALSDLAVISWNIHVGGGDVEALVESLRDGTLTGQPVTRFVLLLQEAYRRGPAVPAALDSRAAGAVRPEIDGRERLDILAVAGKLGLSLVYVPSMRNGGPLETDEDRGNAILSTEPLSDVAAVELPFERQRRVAIDATVSVIGADQSTVDAAADERAPRQPRTPTTPVALLPRHTPAPGSRLDARAGSLGSGRRRRRLQHVVRLRRPGVRRAGLSIRHQGSRRPASDVRRADAPRSPLLPFAGRLASDDDETRTFRIRSPCADGDDQALGTRLTALGSQGCRGRL